MGLTVQQLFDYIDRLTENKSGLILKGNKDKESVLFKIYFANDKYYIDKLKCVENKENVEGRVIADKEELQKFKVKVIRLLNEINVEDIFIE
ncbi:hypothetical protein SAMN02745883_01020 [Caminicella sporogenes DSM 14501]|uniref:Uncharacterized protein n=1 Tax=Caminicella sporogenes DSM 14501 TaxID=1121266 RepID=A0A1M6NXZ4_9FIRM|nr:hypothetical protein [Caminicella sporogenes]RKD21603.1 hypothetical protein BET04_07745 [Caminicella sporogenes]WIF94112.1 hypothetical protein QNI18_07295 [Caminicella sporogenes]SHK00520.1 hypothetical protein SAMN02745883_01020 [Caminicella sporogenes DSM 14501]